MIDQDSGFDPVEKERNLRRESQSWDTTRIARAAPGDIPIVDVAEYFATGSRAALDSAAITLRHASRHVGFYSLVGHQVPASVVQEAFAQTRRFHAMSLADKEALRMDRPEWPVTGAGYLPVRNRKLPRRAKGNENEAFIIKRDGNITLAENQWPAQAHLPGFRKVIEAYASQLEHLALRLLPVYARALEVERGYFEPAFTDPFYRLRLTHYPAFAKRAADDPRFGIAPHVDTTFFTILAQESPGLCVFSQARNSWITVPLVEDAFIVNTGELLKHWSNDVFISARHFANNESSTDSRHSIPFFFNANTDYRMTCIPSCCSPDRPARYPPISYAESQGVVQGE